MKTINFAKRNFKELFRDPMSIIFSIALPLFLLVIFQQFKIPAEQYSLVNFAPSIVIFSYGFISLFVAQLVSKDRTSSLLSRLFSSPMKPMEYILGYTLALIPIVLIQNIVFFTVAVLLGLTLSINIVYSILVLIAISVLFIELGILIGCIVNDKQAPALGSLIIQLIAFTSGMWFSIDQVGKVYGTICKILPFKYTLDISRMIIINEYNNLLLTILTIVGYTLITFICASAVFNKKMISDKL